MDLDYEIVSLRIGPAQRAATTKLKKPSTRIARMKSAESGKIQATAETEPGEVVVMRNWGIGKDRAGRPLRARCPRSRQGAPGRKGGSPAPVFPECLAGLVAKVTDFLELRDPRGRLLQICIADFHGS
jgi:hypothetical protein